jgi:hypothetical protein
LICAAQFVLPLDFSIVNVALSPIQRHFETALRRAECAPPRTIAGAGGI